MDLNADFDKRAVVHSAQMPWLASPMAGVERRMLDRIGDEVARATTVVRYAPGSQFSAHVHTGGEEFFVLEGVFSDEHGDFPAGTYIRNPPESSHTPGSEPGCTILVKLWQFDLADRTHVRIDTGKMQRLPDPARPGVMVTPLFADAREKVSVETWAAGAHVRVDDHAGYEVFVLQGDFHEGGDDFVGESWLRLPAGAPFEAIAGAQGARVLIKRDHLFETPRAPASS